MGDRNEREIAANKEADAHEISLPLARRPRRRLPLDGSNKSATAATPMDHQRTFLLLRPCCCSLRSSHHGSNPVYARSSSLVLAFFNGIRGSGFLKAEFLAIALVLVYVGCGDGAVLFVVMMLTSTSTSCDGIRKHLPLAAGDRRAHRPRDGRRPDGGFA